MKRVKITTSMRVKIFEKDNGICHMCKLKVDAGQEWDVSHEIPLEAGGKDDISNWFVAHRKCHRHHTATVDMPLIAKVNVSERKIWVLKSQELPCQWGKLNMEKKIRWNCS